MELTPETLHAVEFREARRGGYNTRDVDDFLERIAQGVAQLHERLREIQARAEGAEGRLSEMQRQLEETHRRPPAPEVSETDDTLRRTLVLAQRTADATIKEAKDEAARVLSDARAETDRMRSAAEAEARRGTEGLRIQAEAELEHLIDTRDSLNRDIEALGKRMQDQRDRIRSGIDDLEQVLDNPTMFEPVPAVALTEVERPARAEAPAASTSTSALPVRTPSSDSEPVNGHGSGVAEGATPFLPGAQVTSLQEAPPLPARPVPADRPAMAQPAAPFAFNGAANGTPANGGDEASVPQRAQWPAQLRTAFGDQSGAESGPPAPPVTNGTRSSEDVGIEPGSRPSEWGRPVFDREDEDDRLRFGR